MVKSSVFLIPIAGLIVFLAWNAGGVTAPDQRGTLLIVLLICLLNLPVITGRSSFLPRNPALIIPLILIGSAVLVQLAAPAPAPGRELFREILTVNLLLWIIILTPPSPRAGPIIAAFLTCWVLILFLKGLFSAAGFSGTFINRDHFAAYLGIIAPLSLSFGLGEKRPAARWFFRAGFISLGLALILTGSRAGGAAFLFSTCLIILIYLRGSKGRRGAIAVFLLLGLVLVILIGIRVSASPALHELSWRTRGSLWRSTIRMFSARPVLGWGWGTFPWVYPLFKEAPVWYRVPHAHNEYLQLLAEGGLVSFIAVLLCLVWVFRRLVKNFFDFPDGPARWFSLGIIGTLAYIAFHSGFDFILHIPANTYLLFFLVGFSLSFSPPAGFPPFLSGWKRKLLLTGPLFLLCLFLLPIYLGYYRSAREEERGWNELAKNQPAPARESFRAAVGLDPSSASAYYGWALARIGLFYLTGDKIKTFSRVLDDSSRARRLNPYRGDILLSLGELYRRLHSPRQAEESLKEALSLDPTDPFILSELAELELDRKDYDSAISHLRRAVIIYPCHWGSCLNLLLKHTDNYNYLRRLPPDKDIFHLSLGYQLLARKRWEESRREFQRALALNPVNPENWRALGKLYRRTDRLPEAIKVYEKALACPNVPAPIWDELGSLNLVEGKKAEALKCFRKARALDPANKHFLRHEQQLKSAPVGR